MISFDILKDGEWKKLQVEAYPKITDTLDESFDTCQIILERNDDPDPLEPDQDVRAIEGSKEWHFVIMSDQVTVTSSFPLTYRHTVTLAQNISKWKKFLIRNQVFSQPASESAAGKMSVAIVNDGGYVNSYWEPYSQAIPFDTHMKVSAAYHRWGLRATYWDGSKYVNTPMTGTPKGQIMIEGENGIRSNLGDLSDLLRGVPRDSWAKITESKIIGNIKALSRFGAVKILYINGYDAYDDCYSNIPTDQQHPLAFITFTYEIRCDVHYFTMWDVLSQLRDSCAQFVGTDARKPIPYEMPYEHSPFGERLRNTIAPNFTWTQSTLYEALADFFSYYDSMPTLNANNVIGIEEMKPNGEQIESRQVGYSSASSSDERVNGMVNFYSRARRRISVPDTKGNFMGIRSAELGVPSEKGFSIVLPDPIDHITKCEIVIDKFVLAFATTSYAYQPIHVEEPLVIDITDRFIERDVWMQLDKWRWTDANRRYDRDIQTNMIPYDKGSRAISISETYDASLRNHLIDFVMTDAVSGFLGFGQDREHLISAGGTLAIARYKVEKINKPKGGDWKDFRIRIEYVAQTDGKIRSESEEYKIERELISAQGGADCDMGKLGLNMKGLLDRTGNDTRSVTFEITDWANAPKKGQSMGKWVASKVDYAVTNDGRYIATVELSKNFNRLSMRTKIDRSKRMTNVSDDLVQDCEDILTEYVYLSNSDELPMTEIAIESEALREMIGNTFPASAITGKSIDIASCEPYDSNGSRITEDVMIPMRKYDFGNCICFEMRYDSPMSAGNRFDISNGWFGDTYYSSPILYADRAGFFDSADIKLLSAVGDWANEMPLIDATKTEQVGNIGDYLYMKKPNERFGLNYEICFLTDPTLAKEDMVYGKAFFENNGLMNSNHSSTMRLYYDADNPFSDGQIDDGKYVEVEVIYLTGRPNEYRIRCEVQQDYVRNWALADREGNVYIACNIPQKVEENTIAFYLIPSKWRL